jgi:hypothetical protein
VVIVLCVYIIVCGWIPIDVFRFKCVAEKVILILKVILVQQDAEI